MRGFESLILCQKMQIPFWVSAFFLAQVRDSNLSKCNSPVDCCHPASPPDAPYVPPPGGTAIESLILCPSLAASRENGLWPEGIPRGVTPVCGSRGIQRRPQRPLVGVDALIDPNQNIPAHLRDDVGIVPYGFYRGPRMNGVVDPHPSRRSRAIFPGGEGFEERIVTGGKIPGGDYASVRYIMV